MGREKGKAGRPETRELGEGAQENPHRLGRHGNAEIEAEREDPRALPFLGVNLKSLAKK